MNILIAVASESNIPASLAGSTERKNSKMVGLSIISRYANSSKRDSAPGSAAGSARDSVLLLPQDSKTQPPTPNTSFVADTSLPFSTSPPTAAVTAIPTTSQPSSSMIHALFASKGLSLGSGGVVSSQSSAQAQVQLPAASSVSSTPSGGLALLAMLSQGERPSTITAVSAPETHSAVHAEPAAAAPAVVPAHTEPAAPVHAEPVAPVHTEPVAPVHAEPVAPVHAEPVAPVHAEPVAPVHTEPVAPVHAEPVAPVHAEPVAPVHAEPVHAEPVAPVHTEPVAPVHAEPVAPVHAEPVAAAPAAVPAPVGAHVPQNVADQVIGMRPPRNNRRDSIQMFPLNQGAAHCADAYRHYCEQFGVRINSRVSHILSQHDRYSQIPNNPFQDLTSLDVGLCMIRDKGFLPLLEIMRLCVNLTSVNLSDNDLTNEGIEYLAHAVTSGVSGSSFEVNEPNDNSAAPSSSVVESSFGAKLVSMDVSGNRITLGGVRLLQLIADKIPTLVEVKLGSSVHCDSEEIEILQDILSEHR